MEAGWIWILLTVSGAVIAESNNSFYKLNQIEKNPGVYYEYMGEVRIERVKWKIAVTLDLNNLKDPITWREKQISNIMNTCLGIFGKLVCADLIQINKFQLDMKLLKSLHDDLHTFFLAHSKVENSEFTPLTHTLVKRGAPFEFVGWASRQLFGSMDAGDRDQLNEDIDKLYERTANISSLAATQTHIVKSNLEKLHQTLEKDQDRLHDQHLQIIELLNKTQQLDTNTNHSTMIETIARWNYQLDQSTEHSINSYKTLVNTIETAAQGHLHPLLFTQEQLQSIIKTIQVHTLPIENNDITIDILHKLSKTSVSTSNSIRQTSCSVGISTLG